MKSQERGWTISARLLKTIPELRLQRYRAVANAQSVDIAKLYRWNSQVALAIFDDLGVVEVAMRSAMAKELLSTFGSKWFNNPYLFDDGTTNLIKDAIKQGREASRRPATPEEVQGKLVADLMFGFWVKILSKGSFQSIKDSKTGRITSSTKMIYDELLWKPALYRAFPGVGKFDRVTVERAAHDLQFARNRVAHHEHVIWGIPAYGQKEADGKAERRMSITEIHETLLRLSGYINLDLAGWIGANSSLPGVLADCPLPDKSVLKI
ncbi:MAG: Abi family protein [Actinobacteria bacterium]|nr:Abi family protein [Actinomycetota bacterium]